MTYHGVHSKKYEYTDEVLTKQHVNNMSKQLAWLENYLQEQHNVFTNKTNNHKYHLENHTNGLIATHCVENL